MDAINDQNDADFFRMGIIEFAAMKRDVDRAKEARASRGLSRLKEFFGREMDELFKNCVTLEDQVETMEGMKAFLGMDVEERQEARKKMMKYD